MTEFIVSLEQLQKLADKLEPEPKETYKVKITLPKIIRCRDCKHFTTNIHGSYCKKSITTLSNHDGFCAWGERKQ